MASRLKPINKDNTVVINGTEEKIINLPKRREEGITITLGGRAEYGTTLSLEEFENISGRYIIGLEPEGHHSKDDVIQQFEEMLIERDFSLVDESEFILSGGKLQFTTERNVSVSATAYVIQKGDEFTIRVQRNAGYGTSRETEFKGSLATLPYIIDQSAAKLDEYTSTKVQILNKEVADSAREFDDKGFPILKENESLQEYFDNQKMNAGVVVNNAGKYQAFYSYETEYDRNDIQRTDPNFIQKDHRFNCLHYDTKSYKTIKGAEKFLAQQGYDLHGRSLDMIKKEDFSEAFRNFNRHTSYVNSYSDDNTSTYHLDNGFGEIGPLVTDYDETFGYKYSVEFSFTHEATGHQINRTCHIKNSGDNPRVDNPTSFMYDFIKAAKDFENIPDLEPDTRTPREKMDYHRDRVVTLGKELDRFKQMLSKEESGESRDRLASAWEDRMTSLQTTIDGHKKSYKELNSVKENTLER